MTTPSLAGQRRTWHSGHRKYQEVFTAPSHQPGRPTRGPRWLSGQLWARAHWLWSSEHSSHGSYRACLLWVCAPGPPASLLRALPPATCLHSLAHDPLLGCLHTGFSPAPSCPAPIRSLPKTQHVPTVHCAPLGCGAGQGAGTQTAGSALGAQQQRFRLKGHHL